MIPALVVGFVLAAVVSVMVVPILGLVDQLQGYRRFRLARAWLLGVGAAYAELVGVLWCGALWLRYGIIGRLRSEPSKSGVSRRSWRRATPSPKPATARTTWRRTV